MIMTDLIVYPSDYYNLGKVDADLKAEYEGALSTGKFEVILFEYDKWFNDDELVLSCVPRTKRKAVYRGWMMQLRCNCFHYIKRLIYLHYIKNLINS